MIVIKNQMLLIEYFWGNRDFECYFLLLQHTWSV